MARKFASASSEYLEIASAPVTAEPISIGFWVKPTTLAAGILWGMADFSDATKYILIDMDASSQVRMSSRDGSVKRTGFTTGAGMTAGTWHYIRAGINGSGGMSVRIDDQAAATATGASLSANMDQMRIGADPREPVGSYANASMAELALWNRAIDTAEGEMNLVGYCPLFTADGLVFYSRMSRPSGNDADIVGGLVLTDNNTVGSDDHPRVIMPQRPRLVKGAGYTNRACFLTDEFNRSDADSVGGSWTEIGEQGNGWKIDTNQLHMEAVGNDEPSSGIILHSTEIDSPQQRIQFTAEIGLVSASNLKLTVYARNDSASALGQAYSLTITGDSSDGVLCRGGHTINGDPQTDAVNLGAVAMNLHTTASVFLWTIENQAHQVVHKFYKDGAIIATINDTSADRITRRGYLGLRGFTQSGIPAVQSIDVDRIDVCTDRFHTSVRGRHRSYYAFVEDLRGRHDVIHHRFAPPYASPVSLRGKHMVRSAFVQDLRGRHKAVQAFVQDLRGLHMSVYINNVQSLRGLWTQAVSVTFDLRGRHRSEDTSLDRYEVWHGDGTDPDPDAGPPDFTTTTFPFDIAGLGVGKTHKFVWRRRNRFNLVSRNYTHLAITLDASGNAVPTPPSDPLDSIVEPASSGKVRVKAHYDWVKDGTNQADQWLIYTKVGSDPDPAVDTPTVVNMSGTMVDNRVRLVDWESTAFADGADVRVLVRVRRSGTPNVDSANTVAVQATASTSGPAIPGGAGQTIGGFK